MGASTETLFSRLEDELVTILDVATEWTRVLSLEERFALITEHAEAARTMIRELRQP